MRECSAYLLIYGALPTRQQFKAFESEVLHHGVMHSEAEGFFRSFRYAFSELHFALVISYEDEQLRRTPHGYAYKCLCVSRFVLS
jgi:citrate synthase